MKRPARLGSARLRPPRAATHRGQAIVEFALILPVFLLVLLIAVDFGRLYFSLIGIHNAAREGAAFAAESPTDLVSIDTHARQETSSQAQRGESAITVSATCTTASGATMACSQASGGIGPGNLITVKVAEQFSFLTPFMNVFFNDDFKMAASSTAGVLGYAAPGTGTPPGPCPPPAADFVVSITSGTTIFADPTSSTPNSGVCNISGYTWLWGDGGDDVGSATGDAHTYLLAGTYTIRLTVTNQAGPASRVRSVTVPAGPPPPTCTAPKASFTYVKNDKTYAFTDTTTVTDPVGCPVSDWAWDFGDGVLGNAQNPLHTYQGNNAHTVTLVATNAAGPSAPYSHAQ